MASQRLLREPLLHFFVLGALLFAFYAMLNRDVLSTTDEIVVDAARLAALRAQFERVWQRAPTPEELAGLVDSWVREEMLYREGLALGFEDDDPVVRRRVVQKVSFMFEALVDERTTDEELADWLRTHPDVYRIEPAITLRQVYLNPSRYGDDLDARVESLRAEVESDRSMDAGDTTLLPHRIDERSRSDVARSFGNGFAAAVFELPVGEWSGPVASGFGIHLVCVDAVRPPRAPALDEVREAVRRDLLAARRQRAEEAFLDGLRDRYRLVMTAALPATDATSDAGAR
jgi:PPIC-type PPIASE domain